MSDAIRDKIWDLLDEAEDFTYGPARVAMQEEAVRLADEHGLEDDAYRARMELLQTGVFGGFPEKALVAFSWVIAKCDEKPDHFPESSMFSVDLLWAYKWVSMITPGFHQINRPQLESTLEDMKRRFQRNGYSLRPYWMEQVRTHWQIGDGIDAANEAFEGFRMANRDGYADCRACERNFEVHVELWRQDWTRALQVAEPLLNEEDGCAEVPHITYGSVLEPLLELGDLERARAYHKRGYEVIRENRDFVTTVADHIDYLIRIDDLDRALRLFENHLGWAADSRDPSRQLTYFRSGGPLFRALAETRKSVPIRVPKSLDLEWDDMVETERLTAFFEAQASQLAAAFDARNGNTFVSTQLAEHARKTRPGNYAASPRSS